MQCILKTVRLTTGLPKIIFPLQNNRREKKCILIMPLRTISPISGNIICIFRFILFKWEPVAILELSCYHSPIPGSASLMRREHVWGEKGPKNPLLKLTETISGNCHIICFGNRLDHVPS